jgi:hypothetical protein
MACFVAKLDTLLSLDFGKTSGGHFCGWFSLTKTLPLYRILRGDFRTVLVSG